MRQFILTVGTLAAALAACGVAYQGICFIAKGDLANSLLFCFIGTPILLSLAVVFDYINSSLHKEDREVRRALARKQGTQIDVIHPHSKEVIDTPWEDDTSHIHYNANK